jgi:uncharacterized repeat protein (TIGR01451 family)
MGTIKALAISGLTLATVIGMSIAPATASAWHPEGKIVKKVQNVTSKSELMDANTAKDAVAAKPGDILTYVITVSNAQTNDDGKNDMTNTVLTDTLPAGVELVSNPTQRTITENLGTIKPKQSVTKQYQVKVTADKDTVITNKACFTGNTAVNDNPQSGCEEAVVKVTVPAPEQPTTPPTTPETPKAPETPKPETPAPTAPEQPLPSTGPAGALTLAFIASLGGYLFYLKRFAK